MICFVWPIFLNSKKAKAKAQSGILAGVALSAKTSEKKKTKIEIFTLRSYYL